MTPRFRLLKASLRSLLTLPQWHKHLAKLDLMPAAPLVNALLACLPQGGDLTHRAAVALGRAVPRLGEQTNNAVLSDSPSQHTQVNEEARVFVRRLMWHMNEESGNIGWGIPEAFGEILAQHRGLALEFHRILFSYIHNTGHADNFCDHAPLRRSCFAAVARVLQAWPDLEPVAHPALKKGLLDPDPQCQELAAEIVHKFERVTLYD